MGLNNIKRGGNMSRIENNYTPTQPYTPAPPGTEGDTDTNTMSYGKPAA